MTGFWRTWMILWSAGVALFGLVLSMGAIDATSGLVRWNFAALGQPYEEPFGPHLKFALAVMGPICIGWALAIVGAIQVTPSLPPAPARTLWAFVTAGVLVWFVADSLLSVAVGFGLNVFPNLLLVGTYLAGVLGSGVLKRA
jgi:hypothetical protein